MKLFLFKALFWIFTGGLYVRANTELSVQQNFSTFHINVAAGEKEATRLKDVDIANPLFIFK